jgi:oxygen-independent coproporphyrinogen-3 oxidase
MLHRGELPLGRALPVAPRQVLLREMMLQLKTGGVASGYFQKKFGTDILKDFADGFERLRQEGFVKVRDGAVELTRPGLLQVDRLLPTFFEPEYRGTRYT